MIIKEIAMVVIAKCLIVGGDFEDIFQKIT